MKIELDQDDLKEESKDKNCSRIGFFDFPLYIQEILGVAWEKDNSVSIYFWEYGRRSYNRIIVPAYWVYSFCAWGH